MKLETFPRVKSSLQPSNHPYLNGAWTPQHEEVTATDLDVIEGKIPTDIDGVYLRNTENQLHHPLGRYHPFDGDGMIHAIDFRNGTASYRNRWVRTRCFQAEQEAGGSIWGGLADGPAVSKRPGFGAHGGLKDSSSTDIVVHAGARGQGIARALLGWAEQRARELGCCKLTLEVLSNNTRALAAYERAGFAPYVLDPAAGHALFLQKYLPEN